MINFFTMKLLICKNTTKKTFKLLEYSKEKYYLFNLTVKILTGHVNSKIKSIELLLKLWVRPLSKRIHLLLIPESAWLN